MRPPKPKLSDTELARVLQLLDEGQSKSFCAREVSRMRGAERTSEAKLRRARSVSVRWLERELAAVGIQLPKMDRPQPQRVGKTPRSAKPLAAHQEDPPSAKRAGGCHTAPRMAPVQRVPHRRRRPGRMPRPRQGALPEERA